MKNRKNLKRVSIFLATLLSLAIFQFAGSSCAEGDPSKYYSNDTKTTPVTGGGKLKAYVERQTYGEISGSNKSIRYYLTGDYSGSTTVEQIKATWTINAQYYRKTSSSYEAGLTVGENSIKETIKQGESGEYQTVSQVKYWNNTNGSKSVYYGPSNYVMWPQDQLRSHSIQNNVYLKIANHATPYSITAAV